jgi:Protein of unknown function (DUF4244)
MHHLPNLAPARRVVAATGVPTDTGAVSAEYATVTACGVGIGGVLLKLLTSDWGQALLKSLFGFFLKTLGIG